MNSHPNIDLRRRGLLKAGVAAAAGLCVPGALFAAATPDAARLAPNVFVEVTPKAITLVVPRSEMGQGIRTALAMTMCEELDVRLDQVQVLRADGDAKYGDQDTVGDASFLATWTPLRKAAAAARTMLVAAAGRRWSLPVEQLKTDAGRVLAPDGRSLSYGELAAEAAKEEVPSEPRLKEFKDFRLVGKPTPGIDLQAISMGQTQFGLDMHLPGMRYALIERAPLPGMKLKQVDDSAARKVKGVIDVFPLAGKHAAEGPTLDGVVVLGKDSWSCMQGRKALKISWDKGESLAMNDAAMRRAFESAADQGGTVYSSRGDIEAARQQASKHFKRRYYTPYITHAPLEPCNCTAHVTADHCEVWVPSQNPGTARERIAAELGWPLSKVTVHVTAIGGGFGRKSLHDFVLEAVRVSKKAGVPVKLFFTREDDLKHGFYKTPALQEVDAGLDAQGNLLYWRQLSVQSGQDELSSGAQAKQLLNYEVYSGPTRMLYEVPNQRGEGIHIQTPLRRSWVRGVQNVFHALAPNCAIDELAALGGKDPLAWRLAMLEPARKLQFVRTMLPYEFWIDTGRMAAVIRRVGEMSGWGQALASGQGRGIATHWESLGYVAMVAQVKMDGDKGFRIEKIFAAVDCGLVVNPDSARGQVEGAIAFALGAVLYGQISVENGAVVQSNFHDYQVARMTDMPAIEVAFMPSTIAPTGLGEVCVSPVAPAVINAIAAACGKRLSELPLRV